MRWRALQTSEVEGVPGAAGLSSIGSGTERCFVICRSLATFHSMRLGHQKCYEMFATVVFSRAGSSLRERDGRVTPFRNQ